MRLAAVAAAGLAFLIAPALRALSAPDLYSTAELAAALLGVCLVMLPVVLANPLGGTSGIVLAAVTAGLVAGFLQTLPGGSSLEYAPRLAGGLTVTAMTLCIGALANLLIPLVRDEPTAVGWVLAVGLVIVASPLWLVGSWESGPPFTDILVAVNPLTALALPSGADFLRNDWFYRHSPLGSLRYTYPPLPLLVAAYATIGIAGLWLGRGRSRGPAVSRPLSHQTVPPTVAL
jgi:hypothetical protein